MAQITLTIPDAQVDRVVAAICSGTGFTATRPAVTPTPANAKAMVVEWVKDVVMRYEKELAVQSIVIDTTGVAS